MVEKETGTENYIDVTAAIILQNRRILLAKRGPNLIHAGKWEFPGGKVEPGESPQDCLFRELREELNIKVSVGELFLVFEYDYGRDDGKKHRFYSFFCEIIEGEPQLIVHDELRWVKPEELEDFDLIKADKQLVAALKNSLQFNL